MTACSLDYGKLRGTQDGSINSGSGVAGTNGQGGRGGTGGAGSGGHGGNVGSGGRGGGHAGNGGAAGSGGSGISGQDAGCGFLTDAQVEHSTTSCTALFNFESGIEGATVASNATQLAFRGVSKVSSPTYCGTGALAIAASFSGTSGPSVKGEVDLPLATDGGTTNLNGKTITIHLSANPACDPTLKLTVTIVDASAAQQFPLRNVLATANWTTASATLAADAGADSAIKISLDITDISGYQGTIYVDEFDIR
jgi:hypothetical protein